MRFLLAIPCVVGVTATGFSQTDDAPSTKSLREKWSAFYALECEKYDFHLYSAPNKPLKMAEGPRLHWDNPVRIGRTHGDLFIWTHEGRLALVGNVFSYDINPTGESSPTQRRVSHGFHSFAEETVIGRRDGESFLEIKGPAIEPKPIPSAPKPAKIRALRLAQIRALARRFSAEGANAGIPQPLRLLPQPLYRYEKTKGDIDGAVFAFVLGTDPEILMLIDTRETSDGLAWYVAAGRFANTPLKLAYRNQTLWESQSTADSPGYYGRHGIDEQPLEPTISVVQ